MGRTKRVNQTEEGGILRTGIVAGLMNDFNPNRSRVDIVLACPARLSGVKGCHRIGHHLYNLTVAVNHVIRARLPWRREGAESGLSASSRMMHDDHRDSMRPARPMIGRTHEAGLQTDCHRRLWSAFRLSIIELAG